MLGAKIHFEKGVTPAGCYLKSWAQRISLMRFNVGEQRHKRDRLTNVCWLQKEFNMKKEAIIADNAPKEIGAYSNAVRTGNLVFVSGQLPVNPVTGEVAMAIQDQTKQVIENIRNILKDAGATLADVAKVNVVLTEMSLFSEMNAVYAKEFSEPYPARTSMAVKELPHNALVSMDVVAVIG